MMNVIIPRLTVTVSFYNSNIHDPYDRKVDDLKIVSLNFFYACIVSVTN